MNVRPVVVMRCKIGILYLTVFINTDNLGSLARLFRHHRAIQTKHYSIKTSLVPPAHEQVGRFPADRAAQRRAVATNAASQ